MLVFVLVFALAVLFFVLFVFLKEEHETSSLIMLSLSVCSAIILGVMGIVAFAQNVGTAGLIALNQQRYESLTYQLENNLYDNDNDLGKKELYDQIQAWNEDLAEGKAMQHDIWVGAFYPNIFDEFEFIELK